MAVSATCDNCEKSYRLKESMAGKSFPCKACGEKVSVPRPKKKRSTKSGDSDADFMASLNQFAKSSIKMDSITIEPEEDEELRRKQAAQKKKNKKPSAGIPMIQIVVTLGIVAFIVVVVGSLGMYFGGNLMDSVRESVQSVELTTPSEESSDNTENGEPTDNSTPEAPSDPAAKSE